jgi:hypothetical protein
MRFFMVLKNLARVRKARVGSRSEFEKLELTFGTSWILTLDSIWPELALKSPVVLVLGGDMSRC